MPEWPRRLGAALLGFLNHLLRSDMRRSPFFQGVATVLIAWLLGSLVLVLLAPLLEARGSLLPRWATATVYAVTLTLVFLVRRKRGHST